MHYATSAALNKHRKYACLALGTQKRLCCTVPDCSYVTNYRVNLKNHFVAMHMRKEASSSMDDDLVI